MTNETDDRDALQDPGRFLGRGAFRQLLLDTMSTAAGQGARELIFCDPDFADWPLAEPAFVSALQEWSLQGSGRCLILVLDYSLVQQAYPLFVRWRRLWAHQITALQLPREHADRILSGLWTPQAVVWRHNVQLSSGYAGNGSSQLQAMQMQLEDARGFGFPAFPADVLGL